MGSALSATWGAPLPLVGVNASNTTLVVDVQNEGVAAVHSFPSYYGSQTDTITHVGMWISTVSGTPTASSYRIGLQSVGNDGLPSGTWLASGNGYVDITPSTTGWQWFSLGANTVTLTRGDDYCVVCQMIAANDAVNNITVTYASAQFGQLRPGRPYSCTNNGSAWAKQTGTYPAMACKSGNGVYGTPTEGVYTNANAGTTTEIGSTFTIPTQFGATFKLKGMRWRGTTPTTGTNTYTVTLYSNPTSGSIAIQQQTAQIDNDIASVSAQGDRLHSLFFPDATLATLSTGTEYAIGFSDAGANQIAIGYLLVAAAGDFDGYHCGQHLAYCSRTLTDYPPSGNDTNNFSTTTTRRLWMELILEDITAPAGGSGGGPIFGGMVVR